MVDGTTVTSYYLPGHEEAGRRALDVATRSVQVYNDRFGAYPYPHLRVVETYFLIEGSPGGMEYPGLVLVSSEFYDPESSLARSDEPEVVWAHEVAHQWWYGVVGNDQVDDPWLDEALSTYSSILYFEAAAGQKAADRQLRWQCTLPYRAIQVAGGDRPVGTSLDEFDENELAYAAIVYGKGGLFFEKLRELLGNDRFLAMLQGYYAAHRFGVVQPVDFEQSMLAAAGPGEQAAAERLYQNWVIGDGN
jgi:aminopeptidase N